MDNLLLQSQRHSTISVRFAFSLVDAVIIHAFPMSYCEEYSSYTGCGSCVSLNETLDYRDAYTDRERKQSFLLSRLEEILFRCTSFPVISQPFFDAVLLLLGSCYHRKYIDILSARFPLDALESFLERLLKCLLQWNPMLIFRFRTFQRQESKQNDVFDELFPIDYSSIQHANSFIFFNVVLSAPKLNDTCTIMDPPHWYELLLYLYVETLQHPNHLLSRNYERIQLFMIDLVPELGRALKSLILPTNFLHKLEHLAPQISSMLLPQLFISLEPITDSKGDLNMDSIVSSGNHSNNRNSKNRTKNSEPKEVAKR